MKPTLFNKIFNFVLAIIFITAAIIIYINFGLTTKFYMCAACGTITLICAILNLLK